MFNIYLRYSFLVIFFLINASLNAQLVTIGTGYNVSTIASLIGNGNGFADGKSNAAIFNQPSSIAVDASGNVYVGDSGNYCIRKITPDGSVTTLAGKPGIQGSRDGDSNSALFGEIGSIALDNNADILVTDLTYNNVRKISSSSNGLLVSTIIPSSSGLKQPTGIITDRNGNIYISDSANAVIRKYDISGNLSIFAGSVNNTGAIDGSGAAARFAYPTGLCIDTEGKLYVLDYAADTLRTITQSGIVKTIGGFYGAPNVADGYLNTSIGQFSRPYAITISPSDDIFISDGNNLTYIRKISKAGIVSTIAGSSSPGGKDGSGNTASFAGVLGLTCDKNGNLYIANTGTSTIRLASPPLANTPPSVSNLPASLKLNYNSQVTIQALVIGTEPISYNWLLDDVPIANNYYYTGVNTSSLTINNFAQNLSGKYSLIATNNFGSVKTQGTVVQAPITITSQPSSIYIKKGSSSTLSVVVNGTLPSYQWYLNNIAIQGATNATYTILNTDIGNIGNYSVTIFNNVSNVTSSIASVNLLDPAILAQPVSQSVTLGSTVTLNSLSTGLGLNYQWYYNGNPIKGANAPSLTINNFDATYVGNYNLIISNSFGTTTSKNAILTLSNIASHLSNISILSLDGPGSQLLTVGFVTGGQSTTGLQSILIRGIGPSLGIQPFNVANVLSDPTLTIFNNSGNVIATNDNWSNPASNATSITSADASTGAFALTNTESLDAALVVNLSAGNYSVQVAGKNGISGNVLAEIYDNTPITSYTSNTPRLINLSCLAKIPAGAYMSAGFVITGMTQEKVLIRVAGPSLGVEPFNVLGTIPDPRLIIYDSNSKVLKSNAGWNGDLEITTANIATGAFQFNTSFSKDSAAILTLTPGAYTIQATSVSNTGGIALIEIYEVPN